MTLMIIRIYVCVNKHLYKHIFAYIRIIALSVCKGIRDKAVVRIGEEKEHSPALPDKKQKWKKAFLLFFLVA